MRSVIAILFSFFLIQDISGQTDSTLRLILPDGKKHQVGVAIDMPISTFFKTHFAGLSAGYSYSNKRFGILHKVPAKRTGFLGSATISVYLGRDEKVVTSSYHYPLYYLLTTYGGIIHHFSNKIFLTIGAGPSLAYYNKTFRFNIGADLSVGYQLNEKISIKPGILLWKETISDPLYAGTLMVSYSF